MIRIFLPHSTMLMKQPIYFFVFVRKYAPVSDLSAKEERVIRMRGRKKPIFLTAAHKNGRLFCLCHFQLRLGPLSRQNKVGSILVLRKCENRNLNSALPLSLSLFLLSRVVSYIFRLLSDIGLSILNSSPCPLS